MANRGRGGSWASKLLKPKGKVLRQLLPQVPASMRFEPWFFCFAAPTTEAKIHQLSAGVRGAYQRLVGAPDGVPYAELGADAVQGLLNENLVYIHVPLEPTEFVQLRPLDNFIMNRVSGDWLEGLCYRAFISIDERTTVEQLSKVMGVQVGELARVLSLFIRLGFAEKVVVLEEVQQEAALRVALLYDCSLPSALMLGNLGDVKEYAVQLFEAGKLPDKALPKFLSAMEAVSGTDESMLATVERCQATGRAGLFVRAQGFAAGGVDLLRFENLLELDEKSRRRMLERSYRVVVALAPLTLAVGAALEVNLTNFGPPSGHFHSPWNVLYLHVVAGGGGPVVVWPQGDIVRHLPPQFLGFATVRLFRWGADPVTIPVGTLLIAVNDVLPSSPVLVQGFECEGDTVSERAFPCGDLPATVVQHFATEDLIGLVLSVQPRSGVSRLLDVVFGFPSASRRACDEVIAQVERREMFTEAGLTRARESSVRIAAGIAGFVKTWSCGVGRPVRPLSALDGVVKWMD